MGGIAYIGIAAGIALYVTKLISWALLTSPFPKFKNWLNRKPVALGIFDLGFGILGMNVVSIAGGSVIAMLTMISFGTCSMIYIVSTIGWYRVLDWWHRKGVIA